MKRACQRQIVGLPLPTSSALSYTIRTRHTCFYALFSDHGIQPFAVARTEPDLDAFPDPARLT
jgi:hypothetical protein